MDFVLSQGLKTYCYVGIIGSVGSSTLYHMLLGSKLTEHPKNLDVPEPRLQMPDAAPGRFPLRPLTERRHTESDAVVCQSVRFCAPRTGARQKTTSAALPRLLRPHRSDRSGPLDAKPSSKRHLLLPRGLHHRARPSCCSVRPEVRSPPCQGAAVAGKGVSHPVGSPASNGPLEPCPFAHGAGKLTDDVTPVPSPHRQCSLAVPFMSGHSLGLSSPVPEVYGIAIHVTIAIPTGGLPGEPSDYLGRRQNLPRLEL